MMSEHLMNGTTIIVPMEMIKRAVEHYINHAMKEPIVIETIQFFHETPTVVNIHAKVMTDPEIRDIEDLTAASEPLGQRKIQVT